MLGFGYGKLNKDTQTTGFGGSYFLILVKGKDYFEVDNRLYKIIIGHDGTIRSWKDKRVAY